VVKAFEMDGNEGSMQSSGWDWYRGKMCKKYKRCKDTVGRLTPGSGSMAMAMTARCTSSRSSVAATPSSCARCRLPAAPPSQDKSAAV